MLGDVTENGAKIWVRTDQVSDVIIYVTEVEHKTSKSYNATTSEQNEYTAVVQLEGLTASTKYNYSISVDDSRLFEN